MSNIKYHESKVGQSPKTLIVRYMELSDITLASGLCIVLRDRWWIIHPKHGIAFGQLGTKKDAASWGTPQCNSSLHVASTFISETWEGHFIGFIPMVIVPSKPSEWVGT